MYNYLSILLWLILNFEGVNLTVVSLCRAFIYLTVAICIVKAQLIWVNEAKLLAGVERISALVIRTRQNWQV